MENSLDDQRREILVELERTGLRVCDGGVLSLEEPFTAEELALIEKFRELQKQPTDG